jgi:homogentisate 1,2-dioxygenase
MVSVHPVGLPHGPHPKALLAMLDGHRPERFEEVGIMADFANPAWISRFALGLSQTDYMSSWGDYATLPRFQWSPTRLAEVEAAAERLADERDQIRPADEES